MRDTPIVNTLSHVNTGDTPWLDEGLRAFFQYRDLGVVDATGGRVVTQLVRAREAPEQGTDWHQHQAEFHIVLMLKGWARFMYEDKETLVEAGDCVHQRPGIVHFLFDYSPDMEYLEVVGPADFSTVDMPAPCAVPRGATRAPNSLTSAPRRRAHAPGLGSYARMWRPTSWALAVQSTCADSRVSFAA